MFVIVTYGGGAVGGFPTEPLTSSGGGVGTLTAPFLITSYFHSTGTELPSGPPFVVMVILGDC